MCLSAASNSATNQTRKHKYTRSVPHVCRDKGFFLSQVLAERIEGRREKAQDGRNEKKAARNPGAHGSRAFPAQRWRCCAAGASRQAGEQHAASASYPASASCRRTGGARAIAIR